MSTNWKYTAHVICSAESMPGAIQALDIAFPKDDGTPRDASQPQQYGCELSLNGQLPAIHYGSSFVVTEETRKNLENIGLANTPGVTYWRCGNPDGILQTTNHPNEAHIGESWSFDNCVSELGLSRVVREYP